MWKDLKQPGVVPGLICTGALLFALYVVLSLLVGCGGGDPPPEREKDRYVRPAK